MKTACISGEVSVLTKAACFRVSPSRLQIDSSFSKKRISNHTTIILKVVVTEMQRLKEHRLLERF